MIGTTVAVAVGYLFSIVNGEFFKLKKKYQLVEFHPNTDSLIGLQAEEYLYKDHLIHPLIIKRRPYHGASLSFEIK